MAQEVQEKTEQGPGDDATIQTHVPLQAFGSGTGLVDRWLKYKWSDAWYTGVITRCYSAAEQKKMKSNKINFEITYLDGETRNHLLRLDLLYIPQMYWMIVN